MEGRTEDEALSQEVFVEVGCLDLRVAEGLAEERAQVVDREHEDVPAAGGAGQRSGCSSPGAESGAQRAEAAPGNGAETLIEQQREGELWVEGRRGGGWWSTHGFDGGATGAAGAEAAAAKMAAMIIAGSLSSRAASAPGCVVAVRVTAEQVLVANNTRLS